MRIRQIVPWLICFGAATAVLATQSFTASPSGDWTVPGNWSSGTFYPGQSASGDNVVSWIVGSNAGDRTLNLDGVLAEPLGPLASNSFGMRLDPGDNNNMVWNIGLSNPSTSVQFGDADPATDTGGDVFLSEGNDPGSTLTVNQHDGVVAINGALRVGRNGGDVTYNLMDGTLDVNRIAYGGKTLQLGHGNSTSGTILLNQTGGTLLVGSTSALEMNMTAASGGVTTYDISAGDAILDRVTMAGAVGGTTRINATGGTISIDVLNMNGSGAATFDLDGGSASVGNANLNNGSFNFGDGTLAVNTITDGGGAFVWDGGTMRSRNQFDNQDIAYTGNLTLVTGSSPTLDLGEIFSSGGNQFEQLNVSGAFDLSATDDVLDIMSNVHLLRGFGLGVDSGFLTLVDAASIASGEIFNSVVGPSGVSRATDVVTSGATGLVDSIAALGQDEYAIHYDEFTGNVNFIYKVSQTVPEPSTTAMLLVGLFGVMALRDKPEDA